MRTQADQIVLREWLKEIGSGCNKQGKKSNTIVVPEANRAQSLKEIIEFCFPSGLFRDPLRNSKLIAENAILCPKNKDALEINDLAMNLLEGLSMIFLSIDEPIVGNDAYQGFRSDFNLEHIRNEMPSGMPPHKLTLKVSLLFN